MLELYLPKPVFIWIIDFSGNHVGLLLKRGK